MSDVAADAAPEPLKVLLVVDDDSFDRVGSIVQHLCVGMIDDPIQLRLLYRTARKVVPDAVGPVPVMTVPYRWWGWDRSWPDEVLEELDEGRPDIVHALSTRLCRWARQMALSWNCRLVAHITDLDDVAQLGHLVTQSDLLGVTVTTRLREAVERRWPKLRDRLRMIPFGVPAEAEPACLDDPERVPSAIVTTPLEKGCGLEVVLRALNTVVRSGQEVQLFLLSTGNGESALRRQVERLGLRPFVTFAGEMDEWETVGAAMQGADFFIEPNPHRRFSAHMLTAMAGGLAILAPHGTMEDYLIDGTTAHLFHPLRPDDLAAEWLQLLHDRPAARRLAQSGLDYVRTHHQATRMIAATVGLYREVCPGAGS